VKGRVRVAISAASLAAGAMLAGCAASVEDMPPWYAETVRAADAAPYPPLENPPAETRANMDKAHWDSVAADMLAARAEMLANPRATPAPPEDPSGFAVQAQREIDSARDSHADD